MPPIRIELRGQIVDSLWDQEFLADYIAKGVFTPENRIRDALAKAGPDVDLYVNSQGGSVFVGNELTNAVREFALAQGRTLTITVGALAASAAANLVLLSGATVRCHANSKFMFHGAKALLDGGAGAAADTKTLLEKVDADVMAALISRCKLPPEQVQGWFAEGREGWLSAEEAKACGLVTDVIGAEAAPLRVRKDMAAMLEGRGLKLAALAGVELVDAEPAEQIALLRQELDLFRGNYEKQLTARSAAEQDLAARQQELTELQGRLTAAETLTGELQAKLDTALARAKKSETDLAALETRAARAERIADKLTGGQQILTDEHQPQTLAEAVARIQADTGCSGEDAFLAAAKKFPELKAAAAGRFARK